MNTWEAITGFVILLVGVAVFWQSSNSLVQCNSIGGRISSAITSLLGGTGVQACYNSGLLQLGSVITAILGAIIIIAAVSSKSESSGRQKG